MNLRLVKALPTESLSTRFPEERIAWENSSAIPRNGQRKPAQPRALKALELAMHIRSAGYNVYLSGGPNLGRTYMLTNFLAPRARKEATPPDLLYVNNFEDADRPHLLAVPAGQGKTIKNALSKTLQQIRKELPARMETNAYIKKRGELLDEFQGTRTKVLSDMDQMAGGQGFNLDVDDQGSLTLYPLVEGKRLSEDEFEKLDTRLRRSLKRKGDTLLHSMTSMVRQLSQAEKELRTHERDLERTAVSTVLDRYFTPMVEKLCRQAENPALNAFFDNMRSHILDHCEHFLPKEISGPMPLGSLNSLESWGPSQGEYGALYEVNLFVDNSNSKGAPLVQEHHPTFANLLGCVERESEMGALVTDFTLIKAGSLHRANGGYLVINVEDILSSPYAWEGLVRALRSGMARMEDADSLEQSKIKSIEPEALKLNIKVILIGSEDVYESLLSQDERFTKLFKVKAQMHSETERNTTNVRAWLSSVAQIVEEAELLPFQRSALAALVDYASLLCEDHRKLSLKFPLIREVMIEAAALANMSGAKEVSAAHVREARESRQYRSNLVEELYLEEYDRDLIKVQTDGIHIGRVNGLSVTWHSNYEFGLPHRISCIVGVGHGGIIDLEREAELGGPIHTKAMMILKGYLVDQFAHNKPLVLTGSLCFEQNYAGIEGDSASGAELTALLSALSETPVSHSLAFTGAVSQSGDILAVGGVTRKIEGFFDICARRGLTGKQGVILPKDNVEHLMLNQRVQDAVQAGLFSIYPVSHISQALELLTGIPTGKRRKNGTFPAGSLFAKVDARLQELGYLAENSFKKKPRREGDKAAKPAAKSVSKPA